MREPLLRCIATGRAIDCRRTKDVRLPAERVSIAVRMALADSLVTETVVGDDCGTVTSVVGVESANFLKCMHSVEYPGHLPV